MSFEVDILNVDKEIKAHGYQQVLSPNTFLPNSSEPDPEGLASYEIFGRPGSDERMSVYGYIDLGDVFIHPDIFDKIGKMNSVFKEVAYGETKAYIDEDGELIRFAEGDEIPAGAPNGSGIRFLYLNYDKLFFRDTGSAVRRQKMKLLELLTKEEIFVTKWLVIPPFYRDVDGRSKKPNEINDLYNRLIILSRIIRNNKIMFGNSVTDAHRKVIDTLQELYSFFMGVGGTKGFARKHVMGKATDFAARSVISSPDMNTEKPDDTEVSFDRSAIPLATAIKCFAPFIVYGVKVFLQGIIAGSRFIYVRRGGSRIDREELAEHYAEAFSSKAIYKLIDQYSESYASRLAPFTLETAGGEHVPICYHYGDDDREEIGRADLEETFRERAVNSKIYKPLNLTELFYMVAMETIQDKCVYITRYPVEDYNNMYPSQMNIIPAKKTRKVKINGIDYPRFPDFRDLGDSPDYEYLFSDSLRLFPTYLPALGGDYDGDMCSIQGVFTEEGNEEARKRIYSPVNFVNIGGGTMRKTSDVAAHLVFNLTYSKEI